MFAFTLTIHSYSMLFLFVLSSVFSIQSAELRCRLLVTSTLIHIFFLPGASGGSMEQVDSDSALCLRSLRRRCAVGRRVARICHTPLPGKCSSMSAMAMKKQVIQRRVEPLQPQQGSTPLCFVTLDYL